MRRKYPDDATKAVFEAAYYGEADLLDEVLQQMNANERTSALETRTVHQIDSNVRPYFYVQHSLPGHLMVSIKSTPLIAAALNGNVDCVRMLLSYKADIEGRGDQVDNHDDVKVLDKNYSPMFAAAAHRHVDVLNCLVENGADVNASNNRNYTPLMIATSNGHVRAVTFLVKHGANVDAQDKEGNTALHHAVFDRKVELIHTLFALGASQLYNSQRLTPVLLASKKCLISMVEIFIQRPECAKKQRIDALELLGASLVTERCRNYTFNDADTLEAFQYVKRAMEERFQDPSHPLLKQPVEPVEAYQNRKESQTPEELAQIKSDVDAFLMESLMIRERILGLDNRELLGRIQYVAAYHERHENFDIIIGLYKRLMEISKLCDHGGTIYLAPLTVVLYKMVKKCVPLRQEVLVEFLELTFLDYEREVQLRRELDDSLELRMGRVFLHNLLDTSLNLLQILARERLREKDKNSCVTVFVRKLSCSNPRDEYGNTLLHLAAAKCWAVEWYSLQPLGFPSVETVKFLLNAGFNVNAINNNGDTPLHRAVALTPGNDNLRHRLTGMLEVLLDGGAHDDFVNNEGKTAMDVAATDEARRILFERKTLELKCIAARAVKKFALPYLGVVPKTLEKYIRMH